MPLLHEEIVPNLTRDKLTRGRIIGAEHPVPGAFGSAAKPGERPASNQPMNWYTLLSRGGAAIPRSIWSCRGVRTLSE